MTTCPAMQPCLPASCPNMQGCKLAQQIVHHLASVLLHMQTSKCLLNVNNILHGVVHIQTSFATAHVSLHRLRCLGSTCWLKAPDISECHAQDLVRGCRDCQAQSIIAGAQSGHVSQGSAAAAGLVPFRSSSLLPQQQTTHCQQALLGSTAVCVKGLSISGLSWLHL